MSFDKKAYMKKYRQENAEHIKVYNIQWRHEHAEHKKAYDKAYQKNNKDKIKEHQKKWYKNNKENYYVKNRKRRALKNGATGYYTEQDLQYIYEQQKGKCISCNKKIPYEQMTVDHIKPLSKGGSDLPYNIQLLCKSCNSSKGNYHTTDYREFETDLLRNKSTIRLIFKEI